MHFVIAQTGFPVITLIFYLLLIRELRSALPKTSWTPERQDRFHFRMIVSLVIWAVIISFWSLSGMFSRFDLFPVNAAPVIIIPLIAILIFIFSKSGGELVKHIPQHRIIRLQVFRVFVELLLWGLVLDTRLPVQMSFEGRNFDILAGITAPVMAFLSFRNKLSKTVLIIWNLACLGLLVNIVTIAILSMPTPIRYFENEPVNLIVTEFPISFLPGFLVPLAYGLHFLSLKQMFLKHD